MRNYSTQMEAARKGIITPELDNRGAASAGSLR